MNWYYWAQALFCWVVLNPLCPCSTHWCWAQSLCKDRDCRNHSYNQNSSYSLGRVVVLALEFTVIIKEHILLYRNVFLYQKLVIVQRKT